ATTGPESPTDAGRAESAGGAQRPDTPQWRGCSPRSSVSVSVQPSPVSRASDAAETQGRLPTARRGGRSTHGSGEGRRRSVGASRSKEGGWRSVHGSGGGPAGERSPKVSSSSPEGGSWPRT